MSRIFVRGLVVIFPIVVTIALLRWLFTSAEGSLGSLWRAVLPKGSYLPGLGVAAFLILVLVVGALTRVGVARRIGRFAEGRLDQIPLVSTLYGSVKDLIQFVSEGSKGGLGQSVLVKFPNQEFEMVGFVTSEDLTRLSDERNLSEEIAVYLPMSYQIGGFTILVKPERLTKLEMTTEECMRFAMTAGVTRSDSNSNENA